jgi:hypothetical protein
MWQMYTTTLYFQLEKNYTEHGIENGKTSTSPVHYRKPVQYNLVIAVVDWHLKTKLH